MLLLAINMAPNKADVLQGTLDLMVMKTLESLGSQHGYGIAQRLQQISEDLLKLNQGTLYPALLRLEQRGWISSKWGTSENNRRARFYTLTRAGRKQLQREAKENRPDATEKIDRKSGATTQDQDRCDRLVVGSG